MDSKNNNSKSIKGNSISIDPTSELFRWGPIDGRILYIDFFIEQMILFQNQFRISWPDVLSYIKDHRVLVIVDYPKLYECGIKIFNKYINPEDECVRNYKHWLGLATKLEQSYKNLDKNNLRELTDKELIRNVILLFKEYNYFWSFSFIPELANWGGEALLRKEITRFDDTDKHEILEALSAPEDLSFNQLEELKLMKIKLLEKESSALYKKAIEAHCRKYLWLYNSYGKIKPAKIEDFEKRLKETTDIEAEKKIEQIEKYSERIKNKKSKVISKYKLNSHIAGIGSRLSFCIWWQDYRKTFIFKLLHTIRMFIDEIGSRKRIDPDVLENYAPREILNLVNNNVAVSNMDERLKGYISYYHEKENSISYYFGDKANNLMMPFIKKADKGIKEFRGTVVSKGRASGTSRVIMGIKDFDKMKQNDILVTSMTSPEFIVVMRKASAIITDEGGLTSHAAIISRELGVPCIVGTRIATEILKDADLIEVDAEKGIIRKIMPQN